MREPKFDARKIYRFDEESGAFLIDIDLDFYRELYSEWDFSPQRKRDLDNDLLEYLVDCCDEIPVRYPVAIAINLPEAVYDATREERATQGFKNFFTYRIRRETNRYRRYFSKIVKYLCIGALLLIGASMLENFFSKLPHSELLVEGLIIGAWVSIWEVFSVLFFKLSEHRKKNCRISSPASSCNRLSVSIHSGTHPSQSRRIRSVSWREISALPFALLVMDVPKPRHLPEGTSCIDCALIDSPYLAIAWITR